MVLQQILHKICRIELKVDQINEIIKCYRQERVEYEERPKLPKLPIKSFEDFECINTLLKNKETFSYLVRITVVI